MAHKYGGPWTEVKLEAVNYYLKCYATALHAMDTWYIDAFAGTGDWEHETETGGLLEGQPIATETVTLDGSARQALKVTPPFKHFVFIEKEPERVAALAKVKTENPGRHIIIIEGDANDALEKLASKPPWSECGRNKSRGVVFLDPYASQVNWSTVTLLAKTKSLDVWYLFPLNLVNRYLAISADRVGDKAVVLNRLLGDGWLQELYALPDAEAPVQSELFGASPEQPSAQRTVSKTGIEGWFRRRLSAHYAFVPSALPIIAYNRQHFSLFLAVGNPARQAIDLARKFAAYINRKYAPKASRRTSGR